MKNNVEDIQNRVRNYLSAIQNLNDMCSILVSNDADSKLANDTFNLMVKSNIVNYVQKSIEKLIVLAKAADMKINDKDFDIEDYIIKNNISYT